MPKISVIVPVYRVEKYLPVCLDSLRSQSLSDIEIVCVDDGSPDRSRKILDQYAALDNRIVIVSKENGGLSSARNAGVKVATADIVCFVDSDDMMERTACEVIVGAFKTHECDVVTYGGAAFPKHRSTAWIDACLSPHGSVYEKFTSDLLFKENSHPYAWRTALRREFLVKNELYFDEELRFGEDEVFHFSVYPRSAKTVLIEDKLYWYRVERPGSLMATRAGDLTLKSYDHLRIVDKICADWHDLGLIDLYYEDLLSHIADFVLRDLFGAPSEGRMALLRFARSIFETYFTREQLNCLCQDKLYGGIARAILVDGRAAWRIKRKVILYAFTLKTNPFEFIRAAWRRIWSLGPLTGIKNGITSRLPMSAAEQRFLANEAMAEIEEASALSVSKVILDFERVGDR